MTIKSLSSPQIAEIMKKGKAYNSGFFLLKTLKNEEPLKIHTSFIASKKNFIKAVERNRARRIIKEAFTEAFKEVCGGLSLKNASPSMVFLAKKEIIKGDFSEIVYSIKQQIQQFL